MMQSVHRIFRSNEQWLGHKGRVFSTWSIFNPNGPTISCIGATDCGEPDVKSVFLRWINPFKQAAYGLGRIDVAQPAWPKQLQLLLHRALTMEPGEFDADFSLFTCIPSLVTLAGDEAIDPVAREMLREGLKRRDEDWGKELAFSERYGSRLFDRAAAEIGETVERMEAERKQGGPWTEESIQLIRLRYAHLPAFENWTPTSFESAPYSDEAFDLWIAKATDNDYLVKALLQLAQAWVGSIHVVQRGQLQVTATLDDVSGFLWHFGHPLWPKEFTTAKVAKGMGLSHHEPTAAA